MCIWRRFHLVMSKPLVALTGATGFIGQYLLAALTSRGYRMRVLLRRPSALPMQSASAVVGDLARPQNMAAALADVDAVNSLGRHCARNVGIAGRRLPAAQYGGDRPLGARGATCRGEAFRFSFVDPCAIRTERPGRSHRGAGAAPHRRLWALKARGRAGARTAGSSTGRRCGLRSFTDRG